MSDIGESSPFKFLRRTKNDLRELREEHQITLQGVVAMVYTVGIPQLNGNVHLLQMVAGHVGAALWDVRVCVFSSEHTTVHNTRL